MRKIYFNFCSLIFALLCSLLSTAQSNQYLDFDGSDDYASLPEAAQYIYGSNTISMAGWFYTNQLGYGQGMMSIRGGGTGNGEMYVIQLDNGTLECRVVTSTGLNQVVGPAGSAVAGVWQHIAWVFDVNTVKLYINGTLIGTGSAAGTFQSNDRPFTIGKCLLSGSNFVFNGRADEVSLWNKALTQTEIQNMMANELTGTESNLITYYKCNQGTPGGNNTSITQLNNFNGDTSKNADLYNFAMTGATSNFNGTLSADFQTIDFQEVPNKLVSDAPFTISATASSGLPVSFEVVSGPATINGNTVTLTGTSGEVVIKATQAGDSSFQPAESVFETFMALDPAEVVVTSEILHPLSGTVYAPLLMPLQIAFKAGIEYPELFSVSEVTASVDGTSVSMVNHGNGYFTGWWSPTSYGSHTLTVTGTNNFGTDANNSVTFNLVSNATNQNVNATSSLLVNVDIPTATQTTNLPSHIGAFTQITGTLHINCPTDGCDPWDRVSSVEVLGKDGEWYEIIRYITPYGISCQSNIDLTDFKSLLSGRTTFRVNLTTYSTGFLYTLELNYTAGTDVKPYTTIEKLWYQTYQFGDPANLQPTEDITTGFPAGTASAKIKLVSSGHGWGSNNTSNAAEFSDNTHHIWVNNSQTFTQHNYQSCFPNPDGCNFQAGTYQYARAGWCPGSIAQFFNYDMTPYISGTVALDYVFDTGYMDYCHPNNPNCISGVTCADCNDTYNPHLIVSSYLISFGAAPLTPLSTQDNFTVNNLSVYPNPSSGIFYVHADNGTALDKIEVYDLQGRMIKTVKANSSLDATEVNIKNQALGVYIVTATDVNGNSVTKRVVLE